MKKINLSIKLSIKLLIGFSMAAFITLAVGFIGWKSTSNTAKCRKC